MDGGEALGQQLGRSSSRPSERSEREPGSITPVCPYHKHRGYGSRHSLQSAGMTAAILAAPWIVSVSQKTRLLLSRAAHAYSSHSCSRGASPESPRREQEAAAAGSGLIRRSTRAVVERLEAQGSPALIGTPGGAGTLAQPRPEKARPRPGRTTGTQARSAQAGWRLSALHPPRGRNCRNPPGAKCVAEMKAFLRRAGLARSTVTRRVRLTTCSCASWKLSRRVTLLRS
jgi:hypothetical protein